MKLQNLTVIFIIIIIPIILLMSLYISTGLKTIKYQTLYDTGLLNATHDAIYAFELNTAKDNLSNNPEIKRDILKASIKMFKQSLCASCGLSSYNVDSVEEYIPALVFGMYDGFYMYGPSGIYNSDTEKIEGYKHNLKNYVYYSEMLDDGIIIRYSLDNYVVVTYKDSEDEDSYKVKQGYLIDLTDSTADGKKYKGIDISTETINGIENEDAIKYYKEAYEFTSWFLGLDIKKDGEEADYLKISSTNNPEDENSAFVQNKRKIMKDKIEGVLNSSITAYSKRILGETYKMPKLSEDDWQKIYNDISMISFFQGKRIGLTSYNGYCVLNSTNHLEYVNPNLLRFVGNSGDIDYHDIRCSYTMACGGGTGYRIGDFGKKIVEREVAKDDGYGNTVIEIEKSYEYGRGEIACYECINGNTGFTHSSCLDENGELKTIGRYVNDSSADIKTAYWTSLARERYEQTKLEKEIKIPRPDIEFLNSSGYQCGLGQQAIIEPALMNGGVSSQGKISMVINLKFKNTSMPIPRQDILSNTEYSGWVISIINNKIVFSIHKSGHTYERHETNIEIDTTKTYDITVVWDGNKVKIYNAGILCYENLTEISVLTQKSDIPVLIGGNPDASGGIEPGYEDTIFYGKVYKVNIWYNRNFNNDMIKKINEEL